MYKKIKEIAKKRGISIRELERKCDFSQGYLKRWDEINPTFKSVLLVCSVLDCPMDYLIEEEYNSKYKAVKEIYKILERK